MTFKYQQVIKVNFLKILAHKLTNVDKTVSRATDVDHCFCNLQVIVSLISLFSAVKEVLCHLGPVTERPISTNPG